MRSADAGRIHVSAAHDDSHSLAVTQPILAGQQTGQRRRATGFRHHAQLIPQQALSGSNLIVAHEYDAVDELLRNRKHQCPDSSRAERIRGQAAHFDVDWPARVQCTRERGATRGLDRDHFRVAAIPRCDATGQSAAADRDEYRLERRRL